MISIWTYLKFQRPLTLTNRKKDMMGLTYDVVIIGAGPAGGQCARELAQSSQRVLLVDRAKSFQENNYSSGGAPLDVMSTFSLPDSIVGSYWNQLSIHSTQEHVHWQSDHPFGPILDFDRLRHFLAAETTRFGGEVRLGYQYLFHQVRSDQIIEIKLKDLETQQEHWIQSKVIVDATGSERKVLMKKLPEKEHAMIATGIEHHIEVDPTIYAKYAHSLQFFLGHQWMPQGYAWIFPMAPNQLKVGVIRYYQDKQYVSYEPSYRYYLDQMLNLCGKEPTRRLIDRHGKTIHYSLRQKDKRYDGPVLAIGDAISAINPLGCEGIRHALVSGRIAAQEIKQFLNQSQTSFSTYDNRMNHYFGYKWFFSEKMMNSLFKTKHDRLIDKTVRCFGIMNNQDILDVIFNYRFRHTLKAYFWYFISRWR